MKISLGIKAPALARDNWQSTEPWVRFGFNVCIYMIGGLLVWSALVSIAGAVVAPGLVVVESNYKTVAHLDGGIVARILVRNGDRVAKGDVLVQLDATAVRANHTVATGRVNDLLVQNAMLEAERDNRQTFVLPSPLDSTDPAISKIAASQSQLFDARRAAREGERSVLVERVTQIENELRGLRFQETARKKEREINSRELASVLPLFEKGYVNQQRVGPLQREAARLEGEIGRIESDLAKMAAAMSEADLRLKQSTKAFTEGVVDELRKVQSGLAEALETQKSLADKLDRIDIRAPRAGIVHALTLHTEGGIVTPATPILQIVPEDEKLIVEAQLAPQDIDKVRTGQKAGVRFPAFNAHTTPRLEGNIVRISAAQITERDGRNHFTASVEIPALELNKIGTGQTLRPGMPAEVHIETVSRSILSYFLKPLSDALSRTFREG
ncbi:MAG: HlyD family type I secretion periplasmic adaptor subunit [Hyphomicrobium sp.]|nr:HlyD family type I secretion periplasmic adaptor subunit [Hyphomicrobium sp.]PPC81962.1 MAG: hemolysin secretion protein D [Hyphomicrobium sp.]